MSMADVRFQFDAWNRTTLTLKVFGEVLRRLDRGYRWRDPFTGRFVRIERPHDGAVRRAVGPVSREYAEPGPTTPSLS